MAEKPYRNRSGSKFEDDTVVPSPVENTIVEEEVVAPPVVEKEVTIKKSPYPKKYICRTKCWVSSKRDMFFPNDVVEFAEGEFVPSHFDPIE